MAQCCDDATAIFLYGAEDGAPLSAYFQNVIDASINAGTGLNGSHSVHSDYASSSGEYAELSWTSDDHNDVCGNPRMEFAIGGYWNGRNLHDSAGFDIMRVSYIPDDGPYTDGDVDSASWLWIVSRVNFRDLEIYPYGGDDAIYVTNVFDTVDFPFRKIEIIGSVSSDNGAGTLLNGNPDAWIELRVDGVPVGDGDDFEITRDRLKAGLTDPCAQKRATGIATHNAVLGWNVVTFGPMGDLDCIYIKDTASYCDDNPVLKRPGGKCDPAGPGGDGNGPRIIHPGGLATPTYVPPTGGGVPATASDPAEPQSLVDAASALVSLDLSLCDSTVLHFAKEPIVASGRPFAQAAVQQFGPVEYPLSDRFGNFRGQVWFVDIADPDGTLRGYLDSPTNRYYTRWEGHLYVESDVARLAGTARRSAARGRVVSVTTPDDLVVRITFADELSRQDSGSALSADLPRFTIGEIFHGPGTTATGLEFLAMSAPRKDKDSVEQPPQNIREQAMPCLLGECSDEWRSAENPPVTPVGICKAYLLGDVLLKGSEIWQCYLISQYAIKGFVANGVFGSNLATDCPGSVRLDLDALADQFLIPGQGNWSSYFSTNYIDFTWGPQQYRCTVMFATGPISLQHVDGIVPISVNVSGGIEDVGDSTGEAFDDVAYVTQWLIDHPILQQTLTGNWNAVATFPDGVAKIRTSSVTAVKAIHDARLSTRYRCRMIIDRKRPRSEWLAELLVAGHMQAGINHHGQVFLKTLDDGMSLSGLTTYTDQRHIQDGSFRVTSERSGELENHVVYDWGPEPATGRLTGAPVPLDDGPSQTHWGVALAQPLHYQAVGRQDVADDATARRIIQTKDGITLGEFTIDLAGTALDGGQVIRVTDFRGIGSSGWTDRLLRVNGRVANFNVSDPPQANDLTMLVQWEDMQRALAAPSGAVGGGVTADGSTVSAVGFGPVGTTAGANGWTVGDDATGNGWRVG